MGEVVKKQIKLMKYKSPEFFQRLVWIPLRLTMILFCSLEIKGIENVKNTKGSFIFAANHLSEMDPLLLVSVLPFFSRHFPVIYVSLANYKYKEAMWKQFLYGGIFFKMIGAYPTYKGLKNYELALPHHLKILQEKRNVGIFPHGRVTQDMKSAKARGGATFLAHKTNTSIIPVKIIGTEDFTLPNILSKKKKIKFIFGSPISPKQLLPLNKKIIVNNRRNDYEKASKLIMKKISQL